MSQVFIVGLSELPRQVKVARDEVLDWVFVVLSGMASDCRAIRAAETLPFGECCPHGIGSSLPKTKRSGAALPCADGISIPLTIDIDGPGATVNIAALYLCDGDDKIEFDFTIRHNAGGSVSRQLVNGIVGGKAQVSFHGLIYVRQDAQATKAHQENHNILISESARVETTPQLEIYADDVEYSHGATTGFLNADELFYMRSRGIPEAEARKMQMISFLAPVLDRITDPAERRRIRRMVEKAVGKMAG